jgi:putative PIN family toxin of toxin-antitoxin system
MTTALRVVFDCNILLQGLASPEGPAGRCVQLALRGKISLFISPLVLEELREVTGRPRVIAKLHLVADRVQEFFEAVEVTATLLTEFPEPFSHQRDPDDAHYVNLAVAADATLIISRDKDLLDLMDSIKPDGKQFQERFPLLRILEPVAFLREFEESL